MLKIATALLVAMFALPAFAHEPPAKDECKDLRTVIKRVYEQEKAVCRAIRDKNDRSECRADALDRRNDAMDEYDDVCRK